MSNRFPGLMYHFDSDFGSIAEPWSYMCHDFMFIEDHLWLRLRHSWSNAICHSYVDHGAAYSPPLWRLPFIDVYLVSIQVLKSFSLNMTRCLGVHHFFYYQLMWQSRPYWIMSCIFLCMSTSNLFISVNISLGICSENVYMNMTFSMTFFNDFFLSVLA